MKPLTEYFSKESPSEILFWNRGKVITVNPKDVKKVIEQGLRKLSPAECKIYKKGDYNPLYDQGDKSEYKSVIPMNTEDLSGTDIIGDFLKVIEI